MKKALVSRTIVAVFAALWFILSSQAQLTALGTAEDEDEKSDELVIYAYDSFVSEWGPGPQVVEKFEQRYGIPVRLESVGDAGQVLQKAILEKDSPRADLIIGVDNNLLARAKREGVLRPYKSPGLENVPAELVFDPEGYISPYDYGYFAIIYDSQKIDDPPASLEELTDQRFEDQLILMDPRTSTPGLGFLMWTIAVYGDDFPSYWKRLEPSVLTISEGWDSGYGLFTNGEAAMVLSYTTSPAYHVEYEESQRYRVALFEEGHYLQIEGMGILEHAANPEAAEKFIDFSLTEEFQAVIPLTNWMYPVLPELELPDSYEYAPKPGKSLSFPGEKIAENRDRWIDQWLSTVTR